MNFIRNFFSKKSKSVDEKSKSIDEKSKPVDNDDTVYLNAEPISRKCMDLLWLDPPHLAQLEQMFSDADIVIVELGDGVRVDEHEITKDDIRWAKQIERIVDKAYYAGQQGDLHNGIKYYKEALKLAPGCDLFLMSIGTGYATLGQKERGLRYLERAVQISPTNTRIQQNLWGASRS